MNEVNSCTDPILQPSVLPMAQVLLPANFKQDYPTNFRSLPKHERVEILDRVIRKPRPLKRM